VTRTGRPFFAEPAEELAMLDKVRAGLDKAGLWEELDSDWLVIDCDLLPWSAKADELLPVRVGERRSAVPAPNELLSLRARSVK
jgi:hypothetical protein